MDTQVTSEGENLFLRNFLPHRRNEDQAYLGLFFSALHLGLCGISST